MRATVTFTNNRNLNPGPEKAITIYLVANEADDQESNFELSALLADARAEITERELRAATASMRGVDTLEQAIFFVSMLAPANIEITRSAEIEKLIAGITKMEGK
jgi:hypothetical protein